MYNKFLIEFFYHNFLSLRHDFKTLHTFISIKDGKWLAFNSSDIEENQFHITLMNWISKEQKQLTDTTFKSQQAPVFIER